MTLIGASSLCAGAGHLAAGVPRGYNIVEIDTESWTGRVHQRQMVNVLLSLPVWGPGHFTASNASYIDFKICPPASTRPSDLNNRLALERADELLGRGRPSDALAALESLRTVPEARLIMVRALEQLWEPQQVIALLWPPITAAEAVLVGGAILAAGDRGQAQAFLDLPLVSQTTDASVRHVATQVRERRLQ
jgi:hypothetical protein